MLEEFSESQLQLVQMLLDREAKAPGWVVKVLGSAEKIENILDYNGNVVEVLVGAWSGREAQKNEKKRMTVKYLLIEYYTLMKRLDRLPDLPVIERYVDDVFVYMKWGRGGGVRCRERDIQYSVHIIAWLCELLISYSSRK